MNVTGHLRARLAVSSLLRTFEVEWKSTLGKEGFRDFRV